MSNVATASLYEEIEALLPNFQAREPELDALQSFHYDKDRT